MLETLRKKARKAHIIRAAISLAIALGILIWTKFAIFTVLTGPVEVDFTADPASYEGKYVTVDADFILYDYVEHTTTTTQKSGASSTRTDGYSYIVFRWVDNPEEQSSTWYFYSIYMKKADQDAMYARMDDAWNYLSDETGTVALPEPLTLQGTWTKMDSEMESYFRESLAEMALEETEYDVFCCYTLETGNIGGVAAPFFWVLMVVCLGSLIFGIYNLVCCFGSQYAKSINNYLQKNAAISISAIDADFARAHVIGKNTWIGKRWTVYIRGPKAQILTNKDLIWGYYYRRTGRYSVSEMRLYMVNGRLERVSMTENETKEALQYYGMEQPQMIIGYSKDLEKTFKNNLAGFKDLKYNPAMRSDFPTDTQ